MLRKSIASIYCHLHVFTLLTFFGLLCFTNQGYAQIDQWQRDRLISSLRDAATNFDAGRITEAEQAQRKLVDRANELISFLKRQTSAKNSEAWLEYLDLDPILEAIDEEASASTIRREALSLRRRLIGTAPGLELSKVVALRDEVNNLIPAVQYENKDKTAKLVPKQLEAVAKRFEEMEEVPSVDDTATANLILRILQDSEQSAQAIDAIKQQFSHPNISIRISEPVVQRFVNRPLDSTSPVNDCIMGTRIEGCARLVGGVSANLIPSQGSVGLNVAMHGQFASNNRGYNGPISLTSSGQGTVGASRALFISEAGISMTPTIAQVNLQTKLHSIHHPLRFVRRIAWRKAGQTKGQADRIAKSRLQQKVGQQFTEQTDSTANVTPPDFMADVRPILQRLDLPEPSRFIGSTDDYIFLISNLGRFDQLSAPVPAPPIHNAYEGAIQVHESVIDNSLGYLLAGRTVKQSQIDQLMSQTGKARGDQNSGKDDKEKGDEEEDEFEIDFSTVRPIVFEARDGKIRLGIRGTRFQQGRRALKQPLEITAEYAPVTTADGAVMLVRDGDVDVAFPGKRKLSLMQTGLKTTIRKNFADVFPDKLLDQPIVVPQTVKAEAFRGRSYRARAIEANDGWLTVLML